MAVKDKQKTKQLVLVAIMIFCGILVARQYMPMIQLPTDGLIEKEMKRLKAKRNDLTIMHNRNDEWQNELSELREKASLFWVRTKTTSPVEQEVLDEFNNIARLASVNIQSKEPKLLKTPNSTYVQEVELRIDMRGVSMREFTRLLKEVENSRRKFYWASCRIDPDNSQKPTGIRVVARLKAYILTEEANRIFENPAAVKPLTVKQSNKGQNK